MIMKEFPGKGLLSLIFTFLFCITALTAEYTVQVSAFQSINEAVEMVEDLQQKGYYAYYVKSDLGEKGIWYRVRVGKFSDKARADSGGQRIKQTEQLNYFVTVYSTPEDAGMTPVLDKLYKDKVSDPKPDSVPQDPDAPRILVFDNESDTESKPAGDTEALPVLPEDTATYTVNSSTGNTDSKVLFSLTEVMETKGSEQNKEEQYKLFMADMEYADKVYVNARKHGQEIELRQAYEIYKKIVSDYFFIKEVYKAKYKMALCLKDLGKYHDAVQILKNIIPELDADQAALVQYEVGYIYYHHLKQYSKALDELEKVITHYPDTPWAKEAKDLIHLIMTYKIYVVEDNYYDNSNDSTNGD